MLIVPKTQFLVNGITMPRMRLPNGYGQIARIKSQRIRNPYRVRIVTERDPKSHLPVKYETLGYYKTLSEAQKALSEYHDKPYSLSKPVTLQTVWDEWHSQAVAEHSVQPNTMKVYESNWKHIRNKGQYIKYIRPSHIREELLDEKLPVSAPRAILIIYNLLFQYAVQERYVDVNTARQVRIPKIVRERVWNARTPKSAFTPEELGKILQMVGRDKTADAVLYGCLSGWRPSELIALSSSSVNLPMQFVNGGSKTDAGRDRAVPIHPQAREILMRKKGQHLFGFSYYREYIRAFKDLMERLGIEGHTPHDTRRTFITLAKQAGVDEYALKKIVGHSISDITESVYTDRPLSWLIEEINKIPSVRSYTPRRAVL